MSTPVLYLDAQKKTALDNGFAAAFGTAPERYFSAPGRTEIGGNHTDHQHGHVLCGSVNLDMLCCAAPNGENVIRICSEGYPELTVSLDDLLPREEEQSTSAALVRGVAAKMAQMGIALQGFDACMTSDVLSGSGLSSSAAYEVLVANILNYYCNAGFDPIEMAKISQYAENIYFGKPCGLMDQMGAAVGGARAMACMKHVGLKLASDPLYTVSYMGVNGGLVFLLEKLDLLPLFKKYQEEHNKQYHQRSPSFHRDSTKLGILICPV